MTGSTTRSMVPSSKIFFFTPDLLISFQSPFKVCLHLRSHGTTNILSSEEPWIKKFLIYGIYESSSDIQASYAVLFRHGQW